MREDQARSLLLPLADSPGDTVAGRYRVIGFAALMSVMSGCSYPHPSPLPEPERFVVDAPIDSVFRASVQELVKWNFVITFADRSAGVIATARRAVPSEDTLSTILYRGTNCGFRPTGPLGVIDTYWVQVSVALEDLTDSTALRISLGTNASWFDLTENDPDDRLPVTACASAGALERLLAGAIQRRLRA